MYLYPTPDFLPLDAKLNNAGNTYIHTYVHHHHHHQCHCSPGRALASLSYFVMVRHITMWVISSTINLILVTLIRPPETSSGDATRHPVAKQWNTGEKHGHWILPTKHLFHASSVLLHAVNLRHGTDGFTSPPKEGVLRILSPLKSIILGRVWTRESWVQWQAR
jgi:hypothetical protein